jgi:hypothetical protein
MAEKTHGHWLAGCGELRHSCAHLALKSASAVMAGPERG